MATVLSGYFDTSFKAYMTYATSSTNTTYSVSVSSAGVWQDCAWSNYNWKTVLSATSQTSATGSVGVTYWEKGYHGLTSKTFTWERKTSDYSVTVTVKSTQVSSGKNASKSVTFTVPALPSYAVSYNANGGSGAPSGQTKYYGVDLTLSSTKPTRSGYTFVGWGSSATDTTPINQPGGTYTDNAAYTYYASWKKTITLTYNANSGSGAPSSQSATVYNATTSNTFTIPSTVPTRTGYMFLGWSTSESATSASYSAGDSITLSANDTLYAVWRLNVFTVTYNANGGSGAPANQTKTYGTDLVLSSNVPIRQYYAFKGWATSASATTAIYAAGDIYTANAAITLYAVWEVTYIIPRITGVSVTRCDEEGDPQDDGTFALVKFNWATDEDVSSIKIYWKASTDTAYGNNLGVAATGRSGSVSQVVGGGALSEDFAYNFKIEVVDTTDRNSATQILSATLFPIDMLAGGRGVTIGEPAKVEGFVVNMDSTFKKGVAIGKEVEDPEILDVAVPTYLMGGLIQPILEPGMDLDDIVLPNVYVGSNATGSNYLNCPISGMTFILEVFSAGADGQFCQRVTSCSKTDSQTYERFYYQESWGNWKSSQKSIITAWSSDTTDLSVTTTGEAKITLGNKISVGNGFSVSGGGIVIGTGVTRVKVSGKVSIHATSKTTGMAKNLYIKRNGTNVHAVLQNSENASANNYTCVSPVALIEVTEGDVITLHYYATSGDTIKRYSGYSNITVEEV